MIGGTPFNYQTFSTGINCMTPWNQVSGHPYVANGGHQIRDILAIVLFRWMMDDGCIGPTGLLRCSDMYVVTWLAWRFENTLNFKK